MKEIYLYLSSDTSKDIYPDNHAGSFRVKLPQTLYLGGKWTIALLDIDLPKISQNPKPHHITLQTSISTPCIYKSGLNSVIQRLYFSEVKRGLPVYITNPRYMPVSINILDTFDMFITDDKGQKVPFEPGSLECTLHLLKEEGDY